MSKKEYIQTNKEWLETKAKEEGVKPLPKGIYYKVINEGKDDGKHPSPRQYRYCTLHGVDYKRKEVRHQSWWNTNSVPFERTDRGLDYRNATDVYRGQMGDLHPCRNGIWQVLATRHTRWFNTHLRDRTFRNCINQERLHIHSKKCFILLIFNIIHSFMSRFFSYLYK